MFASTQAGSTGPGRAPAGVEAGSPAAGEAAPHHSAVSTASLKYQQGVDYARKRKLNLYSRLQAERPLMSRISNGGSGAAPQDSFSGPAFPQAANGDAAPASVPASAALACGHSTPGGSLSGQPTQLQAGAEPLVHLRPAGRAEASIATAQRDSSDAAGAPGRAAGKLHWRGFLCERPCSRVSGQIRSPVA